jgi:hypothetical protein
VGPTSEQERRISELKLGLGEKLLWQLRTEATKNQAERKNSRALACGQEKSLGLASGNQPDLISALCRTSGQRHEAEFETRSSMTGGKRKSQQQTKT